MSGKSGKLASKSGKLAAYCIFYASRYHRPGRFGRAKPRLGASSCGGWTSSCSLLSVISSRVDASIWTALALEGMVSEYKEAVFSLNTKTEKTSRTCKRTFFETLIPSPSASWSAAMRVLAYSMRSLMDELAGHV